ncbi:nitroreductase/quinone reductase family protein [Parafrankia sp. Ea1.12]|uniref:nitroreductase/quinone reductase family protein n=1 Tax=Parafrankia sp. Ea1.12 TaxID=573499 RepID=UPI00135AD5E9
MAAAGYGDLGDEGVGEAAQRGGVPEPPAWFRNLEADSDVEVQLKGERCTAPGPRRRRQKRSRQYE